ncbi:MAG: MFS transporter [Wujia sp.]
MERISRQNMFLNIKYFLLQVMFWGGAVVIYAYKTQILTFKGYTPVEIGILNAAELSAGAFFQIILGSLADKYAAKGPLKPLISALAGGTALLSVAFYLTGKNFPLMFLISVGYGVTFTTISPLLDSLAVLYVNHGYPVNYAKGRTGGSIAWAVFCVLAGVYCDKIGVKTFPLTAVVFSILLFALMLMMPWKRMKHTQPDGKKEQEATVHTVLYILKEKKKYVLFLLASVFMFMGYNMGTTFLIDVITGLGGNNTHYGVSQFVMAIAEVPGAFILLRSRGKVPLDKMMLCCSVFMTLKAALPAYCHSLPVVIFAQACEMLGFGLFYSGSVYLIAELLDPQDIVKGTTLCCVATVGIGEGVGSFLSGIVRRHFGLYGLMRGSVYVSVAAVVLMVIMCYMKAETKDCKEIS